MPPQYMSADELATLMKSDKAPFQDYYVVDVRDDDRIGGHIKGSHNSPSADFLVNVDELVKQTKDVKRVIFHCALSQVRGPKAARIYSETRNLHQIDDGNIQHEVYILRGGFSDFQAKYRNDPDLVEDWDEEIWGQEWSV